MASQDKADLVHESTHFTDATTTLWGLEYNYRKALCSDPNTPSQERKLYLPVFMLNTSEIDAHESNLKVFDESIPLSTCSIKPYPMQDPQWGPLLLAEFRVGEKAVLEVPITMRSLLEANAYANENLSRFADAALLADSKERAATIENIKRNYDAVKDNKKLTEYTLFFHIVDRRFSWLDLPYRLRLISGVVRICLDLDMFQLSDLGQLWQHAFDNVPAGEALAFELLRGSSRAIAAFGILQSLANFLDMQSSDSKQKIGPSLADFQTLRQLVQVLNILSETVMLQHEFCHLLKAIGNRSVGFDKTIILGSVKVNRPLVANSPCADNFFELTLPDPLVGPANKHSLQLPKRFNLRINGLNDQRFSPLRMLHLRYATANISKFFVRFDDITDSHPDGRKAN